MTQHGVFNSFWDGTHPHHLPFLTMRALETDSAEWNLHTSLARLYSILDTSTEADTVEGIKLLLQDSNWRPQLVACVAVAAIAPSKRAGLINLFWDRVLKGSWVCPQLLVILYLADTDFASFAKLITDSNDERTYSLKTKAAAEYLVTGVVNDTEKSDLGASIAQNWKQGLLNMADSGRARLLL